MAIVTSLIPWQIYNKIHMQSVYSVIRLLFLIRLRGISKIITAELGINEE